MRWIDLINARVQMCLWLASGRLSDHFRVFFRFTLLNNDHEVMQIKLCLSWFPRKTLISRNKHTSSFFLLSNRKLLRSPPSCLLPFHETLRALLQKARISPAQRVFDVLKANQRRWRRIIYLPVMEHNTAVKIVIFPVFGWKFPGKQDTTEPHPGRGYVSTRWQISWFHNSFPSLFSRATSSMILWLGHADTERRLGSWWISVQRLRWWTFVKLPFVRN